MDGTNEDLPCRFCGKKIPNQKRRVHTSAHILRSQRSVFEAGLKEQVQVIDTCIIFGLIAS